MARIRTSPADTNPSAARPAGMSMVVGVGEAAASEAVPEV